MAGFDRSGKLVTIFGGSGFVGRNVVRALARRGWDIRVAVRRPELAHFLQPLGMVGQIVAVQANVRSRASVARALAGADAAINLVGILAESRRQTFDAIHVGGARTIAEESARAGIGNLAHMSALGAVSDSPSVYLRTKAAGEAAVLAARPGARIFRPSIQFGPEDQFFNRFAGMATVSPVLPLIGGDTKLQPVFVGDVAEAIARAIEGAGRPGTTYEVGGPETKTFRECLELIFAEIGRSRALLPIPFGLARLIGAILQRLPGKILTADQVTQLRFDNVVSDAAKAEGRTLDAFGIDPTSLAAILPTYLVRFRPKGEFDRPPRLKASADSESH